ncbi:uncharacterized protein LOC129763627 isoform X3 [Toxorhynchites rutilus septentrionalis]|uniref:uncharacterized protein LOC129763627 isoform X3 n=1 Tax=Toxorhynchites rutilus septentrionalis TaxID=329112 RepID=UPI002479561A|nr:uncharacterized protein LOC129763627 isoform X3 [Toxorhynchites rutilus septentrionalis]
MDVPGGSDAKRFLETLVLRAEDVLGKMAYKVHENLATMDEMIPMINSVYTFVNTWEKSLQDISMDLVLTGPGGNQPRDQEHSSHREVQEIDASSKKPPKGCLKKNAQKTKRETKPVFEYLEYSLESYYPHQTGRCAISFVGPADLSFCMLDRKVRSEFVKIMGTLENMGSTVLIQLTQLPAAGTVFAVYMDNMYFRAVRNTVHTESSAPPLEGAYVYLLETGEVLEYEESMSVYSLPEHYQKPPAYAMHCVLVNVKADAECDDMHQFLLDNMHTNVYYRVVSVENSILFLELSKLCFDDDESDCQMSAIISNENSARFDPVEPNSSNENSSLRSDTVDKVPRRVRFMDDKSDCSFRGYEPANDDNFSQPYKHMVPAIESKISLIPKFIRGVDHFWCQVVTEYNDPVKYVLEMETKMNDPTVVARYRKLTRPPYFRQRVFALYGDKRWYRAQVARYYDERNVSVFYVDYGNMEMVTTNELRHWDDHFDYLPHQAMLCRFASVLEMKLYHKQAVVELNRKLLDKQFKAEIADNICPWEVRLFDDDGYDFIEGLVMAGLAKRIE